MVVEEGALALSALYSSNKNSSSSNNNIREVVMTTAATVVVVVTAVIVAVAVASFKFVNFVCLICRLVSNRNQWTKP